MGTLKTSGGPWYDSLGYVYFPALDSSLAQGTIAIVGTMKSSDQLAVRIRRLLELVLPHGLPVVVKPREAVGPAFDVTVKTGATEHHFIVGWAGEGWPSDVKRLAHLVPAVDVVTAVQLSAGARRWLQQASLGWADEAGHADISMQSGLVIFRQPDAVLKNREPPMHWTRSTLAVAEAALSGIAPTVEGIEQATGLSRHATANALSRLEALGFLQRSGALRGPQSARRIINIRAFLDAYAKAAAEQRQRQSPVLVHRLWKRDALETLATEIGPALTRANASWAATGAAASVLLAPYISDVTTLDLYIDADTLSDRTRLASLLEGRIVEKGHRIEVRAVPTAMTVKGPMIDDIQVALPVRVYADLRASGGRWAEAGQHLRETLDVGTAA